MLRQLALHQLDQMLAGAQALPTRPAAGWLRAIRRALGQTTHQLAQAVGVNQRSVVAVERAEAKGAVTVATLERYADALGCDLRYVLVPRQSLATTVEQRAEKIAIEQVSKARHTMALEGQATSDEMRSREIDDLKRRLLDGKLSRLWQ